MLALQVPTSWDKNRREPRPRSKNQLGRQTPSLDPQSDDGSCASPLRWMHSTGKPNLQFNVAQRPTGKAIHWYETITFTRSSLSASSESRVPTRRSGTLNCVPQDHRDDYKGGKQQEKQDIKGRRLRDRAGCRRSAWRWIRGAGSRRWWRSRGREARRSSTSRWPPLEETDHDAIAGDGLICCFTFNGRTWTGINRRGHD